MFEKQVMSMIEDRRSRIVDGGSWIVDRRACDFTAAVFSRVTILDFRSAFLMAVTALALLLPSASSAQQQWYYHTIHSNSLAVQYGRTIKLTYANQSSRTRQFKLSLYYLADEFDLGEDRVKSDMYNLNLEFQYHLLHLGRVFVNGHAGFGGYHLQAKNLIDQKHDETNISFIGGFQGEYFIQKGAFALVVDYDVLYTPWSDVYEFLHLPRIGLGWTF